MDKILDPIMNKLLDRGFVEDGNAEIVRYGLELIIMKAIISAAMITAAVFTESIPEVLVFILIYAVLRGCCGGVHSFGQL